MKLTGVFSLIGHVFSNLRKMIRISWEMDSYLTVGYYATAMFGALTPIISAITLKYLIDNIVFTHTPNLISSIPLILVVILASRYVLILSENIILWGLNRVYYDYLFRYKIQNALNRLFYTKLSGLDIGHLENPTTQNLISKVRDTVTWRPPDFLRQFSYFFGSSAAFIFSFILLLPFGVWVPLVIMASTLPRLILRARYGTIQWSIYGSGAPKVRKLWYLTWLLSTQMAIREMRVFQSKDALIARLKETQDYLLSLNKKPLDNYLRLLTIPPLLETIVLFVVAYSFLPQVLHGIVTIGSFTLLINMVDQLNNSSANAVSNFGEMYENNLYVDNFFEILSLPQLIQEAEKPVVFETIAPPKIEFRNVFFQYPNGPLVLKNISFLMKPGESIALVGANGAGKSTIIKLICRFYDVTGGEILVNDVNIKLLKLSNWYRFTGTLFQDFVHYYLTVKDNIVLGDPSHEDMERIVDAAKKAGAYEFIQKLPMQFEQILGREYEAGEELSSGQWQKLAIARAFYQASPLLILDEPTSSIDAEAEYEIFTNLEKMYKGKSLLLVSHRFSTVRNAHKILVVENGEIIEEGTHKALLKLGKRYVRMFATQAAGYK